MRLTLLSLGLAIAAAVFLLMHPTYSGLNNNRPTRATLLEVNGQWPIVPGLFPVVVALVPVVSRTESSGWSLGSCSAGSRSSAGLA